MLDWLEKIWGKPRLPNPGPARVSWDAVGIVPQGNPGKGTSFNIAFTSENRSWQEKIDLPALLAEALHASGLEAQTSVGEVRLTESKLVLCPAIFTWQPLDNGQGADSCTTIEIRHPDVFDRVFEYQHSSGSTMRESVIEGFSSWIELDLPVLLDALRESPEHSTCLIIPVRKEGHPERWKRVLLGPTRHTATPQQPQPDISGEGTENEEHSPGCACCFFTRLHPVLTPLIEAPGFCAVRVFCMRGENGGTGADCRVNGEDFEPGAQALRAYAADRPGSHFEMRKQLIVIQDWRDPGK